MFTLLWIILLAGLYLGFRAMFRIAKRIVTLEKQVETLKSAPASSCPDCAELMADVELRITDRMQNHAIHYLKIVDDIDQFGELLKKYDHHWNQMLTEQAGDLDRMSGKITNITSIIDFLLATYAKTIPAEQQMA